MKSVSFWGITFLSASHMHWFQFNMVNLCFIISLVLIGMLYKKRKYKNLPLVWVIPNILASLAVCITAIMVTDYGIINKGDFSGDCIWFNAGMALIYGVILLLYLTLPRILQVVSKFLRTLKQSFINLIPLEHSSRHNSR